ncbi:MAG: WG repeat-containing protein [Fibromonadaceae bacterium]|jgi:hypothetical protein|nr:WG repeat-containing protein [Fibromonadaceae bacterium]
MNKIATIAAITLLALLLLIGCGNRSNATKNADLSVLEQNNDIWIAFRDDSLDLIGYKDKNGTIKIKPTFSDVSSDKFDRIIVVTAKYDGKWTNYFLTKEGRIFGIDSVYFFDNYIHRQCEGFLNFIDRKTDNIGMFDRNGNVVIPADYNYLEKVRNGMLAARKGAKKECLDKYCEHSKFVGGKVMLLDTLNNVLIENFTTWDGDTTFLGNLDFFSVEKSKVPHSDTTRISYLAKDGSYYSFTVIEREFRQLLFNGMLDMKKELSSILNSESEYYIYVSHSVADCDNHKIELCISHKVSGEQNCFKFLRTKNEYKLIEW